MTTEMMTTLDTEFKSIEEELDDKNLTRYYFCKVFNTKNCVCFFKENMCGK